MRPADDGLTPAMRQYAQQKAQVADAILLFRMGDFYEMFYEDARTASRVLGLTLTTRSKDPPIPLAGIPYHALNGYLAKLVAAGFKVAISEQVEDAAQAKGVVRREIARIVTPGTLTDEALLDAHLDNTLAAVVGDAPAPDRSDARSEHETPPTASRDSRQTSGAAAGARPSAMASVVPLAASKHRGGRPQVGLACVELASGRFWAEMIPADDLLDELTRLRPSEVITVETPIDRPLRLSGPLRESIGAAVTARPPDRFDAQRTRALLCDHFGVATLEGFGFAEFDDSLRAAGAILDYLRETQRAALSHVRTISPRQSDRFAGVHAAALRGLEVERTLRDGARESTLLWAVDRTCNPMGARRLRHWLCFPLRRADDIRARQDAVAALRADRPRLAGLRAALRGLVDVERVIGRLGVGRAGPRDLAGLGRSLRGAMELAGLLRQTAPIEAAEAPTRSPSMLSEAASRLFDWNELADYLCGALVPDAPAAARDGDFIADGFDAELDRLRALQRDGRAWLAEFQAREAARTGIPSLKVAYNQVFGYYIEITHAHRDKVPPDYVRRQTVRNAERYITDELKRHEEDVLAAADRARQREADLFDQVTRRAQRDLERLQRTAGALGDLDALAGLAELSQERGYCRPELVDAGDDGPPLIEIVGGRHPVLDQTLGPRFVPNDCRLDAGAGLLAIITGPNMAGKSTFIRQTALLTLLAQTGSFVPAASMRWSPVDRIFARIGASDELARGQSTFMVEMVETAQILNNATRHSLVVLDEIGRGTSTFDGVALAWAICEDLVRSTGCRTLFATHYHELTELAAVLPSVLNLSVLVREHRRPDGREDVIFLHRIAPGATDKSYGVHVARLAGIPPAVVRRAADVLSELERNFHDESRTPRMRTRRAAAGGDGQAWLFADERPGDEV